MDRWQQSRSELEDLEILLELAIEEQDDESLQEAAEGLEELDQVVHGMEFACMMSGEADPNSCYIQISSGEGGTDAKDWASMLMRMYLRYAEHRGYKTEVIDFIPGEEAGLSTAVLRIDGDHAYGYLKAENGVHRLVRISPFDAAGRRHTSFASVYVWPEVDDAIVIEVRDDDLRVDTYRSSGAGGQHVNKTDSAVRMTHLPTGIVVQCQNERSQHKNRSTAMKMLKAKLYEQKLQEKRAKASAIHAAKNTIGFGSQIRSYVLQPYRLVKDLRTGVEVGNVDAVLDGRLDPFIEAFLLAEGGTGS